MESICRNTIMKKGTEQTIGTGKVMFLLLAVSLACTLSGCGQKRDAGHAAGTTGSEAAGEQSTEATEAADGEKVTTMSDLLGSPDGNETDDGAESLPDTILWFNATYAPLTYSNSGDWKQVGGGEIAGIDSRMLQYLLERDWDIQDKDSALETVESLKRKGHRAKCRSCMEELEEMGLLDCSEKEFAQRLTESGIEENLFRYVIAYYLYQDGLDADYIAAWDLCRVNQLYADFYICGYMTFEEAMDASLENSKILQQMYPSWEAMMDSYMLGYQFWQSDPCVTEDSPTLKRYSYYEILHEMDDGPYTLDWNMELKKSW